MTAGVHRAAVENRRTPCHRPLFGRAYAAATRAPSRLDRNLAVGALLEGRWAKPATNDHHAASRRREDPGTNCGTKTYTAAVSDLQSIQHDIASHVAESVRVPVETPEQRRLSAAGTTSADAYLLYVKGRRLLEKRTVDSVQQSKDYFEQALDSIRHLQGVG